MRRTVPQRWTRNNNCEKRSVPQGTKYALMLQWGSVLPPLERQSLRKWTRYGTLCLQSQTSGGWGQACLPSTACFVSTRTAKPGLYIVRHILKTKIKQNPQGGLEQAWRSVSPRQHEKWVLCRKVPGALLGFLETLWELLLKPGQGFVFEYICVSMHQELPSEESIARTLAELGLQDLLEILGFGGGTCARCGGSLNIGHRAEPPIPEWVRLELWHRTQPWGILF